MKKKIIACILALGVTVSASGCSLHRFSNQGNAPTNEALDNRFTIIEQGDYWYIFYDTKTKVIYFMSYGNYNSGTTPLLDSEGNVQFYRKGGSY